MTLDNGKQSTTDYPCEVRIKKLEAALDRSARDAHGYGLVRDHWKPNTDGPVPFEECTALECVEARELLGEKP